MAIKKASACTLTKEEKKTIKVFKDTLAKSYMLALNDVENELLLSNSTKNLGLKMALATQVFSHKILIESSRAFMSQKKD